jgi:protein-tyrosine phosphatase
VRGLVDLHSHYLPGVDDGARSVEEAIRMCTELGRLGYEVVIATPHVRTAIFENPVTALKDAYRRFVEQLAKVADAPGTGLAAEYFCDDVFWRLFESGEVLRYPGNGALLLELPPEMVPVNIEQRLFRMVVQGVRPLLAHPERHRFVFGSTLPIEGVLRAGALGLLDLMSLAGRHGEGPRQAAERMLEEGVYFAACSDAHRPEDAQWVERGIERLEDLLGEDAARELLADNPRQILAPAGRVP